MNDSSFPRSILGESIPTRLIFFDTRYFAVDISNPGFSVDNAIKKIRDERPGSIQSEVQELAIGFYEKHVRN